MYLKRSPCNQFVFPLANALYQKPFQHKSWKTLLATSKSRGLQIFEAKCAENQLSYSTKICMRCAHYCNETASRSQALNIQTIVMFFPVFQSAVCHMENRQRQAVKGLYRYIFCHESALRTQGVHPYQVSNNMDSFACVC